MKVLLTGACGFVASTFLQATAEAGLDRQIIGLDACRAISSNHEGGRRRSQYKQLGVRYG